MFPYTSPDESLCVINNLLCELITANQSFLVVFSFYSKDSRVQKGGV